jgi:hypothetical protein
MTTHWEQGKEPPPPPKEILSSNSGTLNPKPNQRSSSSHPLVSLPWADSTLIIKFSEFFKLYIYI